MSSNIQDPFQESRSGSGSCGCYECVGSKYVYDDQGNRHIQNNFKHHTFLEPCDKCGTPKTEFRDLGTKGYYVCWRCEKRANY